MLLRVHRLELVRTQACVDCVVFALHYAHHVAVDVSVRSNGLTLVHQGRVSVRQATPLASLSDGLIGPVSQVDLLLGRSAREVSCRPVRPTSRLGPFLAVIGVMAVVGLERRRHMAGELQVLVGGTDGSACARRCTVMVDKKIACSCGQNVHRILIHSCQLLAIHPRP